MTPQTVHLIGGCGSSGTTALATLLDGLPETVSGPESGAFHHRWVWTERPVGRALLRALLEDFAGVDLHIDEHTYALVPRVFLMHREHYGLDRPGDLYDLVNACAEPEDFPRLLRARFLAKHGLDQELTLIDQTPKNCLAAREYLQAVPGARFVHLVRDGLDVCASLARRYGSEWSRASREVHLAAAASRWLYDVHHARRARGMSGYLEVRYEDLVREPLMTVNRIRTHLGVRTVDASELTHPVQKVAGTVGSAMHGGAKPSWTARPGAPLTDRAVGRWKQDLSASEVDALLAFSFQPPDLDVPLDFAMTRASLGAEPVLQAEG